MIVKDQPEPTGQKMVAQIRVIRHKHVCAKLQISSAKLVDADRKLTIY